MHVSTKNNRKLAFVHVTNSPVVNPNFLGQEFVLGSLTVGSRTSSLNVSNTVFCNSASLSEPRMREKQQMMASERYNHSLVPLTGASPEEAAGQIKGMVASLVAGGSDVIVDFHYPASKAPVIKALSAAIEECGIGPSVRIVAHLHMMMDYVIAVNGEPKGGKYGRTISSFSRSFSELTHFLDGIVAVSEAVRESCVSFLAREPDALKSAELGRISVIKNGVDPTIYVPADAAARHKSRAEIGFAPNLGTLACFVGRLEKIKGVDTLFEILSHFEHSSNPKDSGTGFLIATADALRPETDIRRKESFDRLLAFKRLISEGRLRVALDISKFTRGESRFAEDVGSILQSYASPGFGELCQSGLWGGMIERPAQSISDIALVPSLSEALSLATVEAVYSGSYVLASNTGGLKEVVPDLNAGMLIPVVPGDPESSAKSFIMAMRTASHMRQSAVDDINTNLNTTFFNTHSDTGMYGMLENLALSLPRTRRVS